MIPGIMLVVMCGVMAIFPPGPVKEPVAKEKEAKVEYVLDDPESHRYKLGEINWKAVRK